MAAVWASAMTGRVAGGSGRLVCLVRDRAFPGSVERGSAELGDRRVVTLFLTDPGPVAGEVIPQDHFIEDPKSLQGINRPAAVALGSRLTCSPAARLCTAVTSYSNLT
jgi:hypothetical protein